MQTHVIIVFIVAITLNAVANILLKASALTKDEMSVDGLIKAYVLNPYLILGVLSFAFALVAYRYVLNHGIKVSAAYPVMTTGGYAIVIVLSFMLFNETLNLIQWAGIGLLIAGIWLISSQMGAA